jgi:hypothetical protein
MSKDRYIIDDLEEFTLSARRLVFNGFGKGLVEDPDELSSLMSTISEEDSHEMNQVLTQQESLVIVKHLAKEQVNKKTNETRYIIDEKIFSEIIEAMNGRLVANILASLASKGLIESAYDEQLNDFVFWVNENEENKDENPETD